MAGESGPGDRAPGQRERKSPPHSPEQRRRVLAALYPEIGERGHWWFRFGVMMTLSVVVAVMGLSEDSAAVVIGAMLIAPLMTPVLGIGAGVAMGWPARIRQSTLATMSGAIGSVGVSWVLTEVLPEADRSLTSQVLSRTSPDLRDLVIGLAAGAAGAYAVSRKDISAALPGVAVAVALMPPLASAGFALAIGRPDLTAGALLLFVTNLIAIVLAATGVFLFSGFVPFGRRERAAAKIRFGVIVVVAGLIAVSIPLGIQTYMAAEHATTTRQVNEVALTWLTTVPGLHLGKLNINGSLVTVEVDGPAQPPSTSSLARSLESILGHNVAVQVRWFQTGTSSKTKEVSTTAPLDLSLLRPIVERWLEGGVASSAGIAITAIDVSGHSVSVSLSGPNPPPEVNKLADLIAKRTGQSVNVSVKWTTPTTTTVSKMPASTSTTSGASSETGQPVRTGEVRVTGGGQPIAHQFGNRDPGRVHELRVAASARGG